MQAEFITDVYTEELSAMFEREQSSVITALLRQKDFLF